MDAKLQQNGETIGNKRPILITFNDLQGDKRYDQLLT